MIKTRNFERAYPTWCMEGGTMGNDERKKCIIEMVEKIDNTEFLMRIFNYVHKYFIRRTGS